MGKIKNLTGLINGINTRFKKGIIPWCKGKKLSEEHKNKLRLAKLGKKQSKEHRMKISKALKGKNLGEKNGMWGKKNELCPFWKGDNVGYNGLHNWVRKNLDNLDTCEFCGKTGLTGKKIQWANIDHSYKRNIDDWLRLCVSCHRKYDIQNNKYKYHLS